MPRSPALTALSKPPPPSQEDFNAAAEAIKPVDGVSTENMLKLYGLYKQSTVGDNTTGK